MKLKRISIYALIFAAALLATGVILTFIHINSLGSFELIGIRRPSFWWWLSVAFDGIPLILVMISIPLMVSAAFCLIFSNTVKASCNIKTTSISLALSAVGALGLDCVLYWFTIVVFGEMSKYPNLYPIGIACGLLCLAAFAILIGVYFKTRKACWSAKGFIIDVLTSILYLPAFFFLFAYLISLVRI